MIRGKVRSLGLSHVGARLRFARAWPLAACRLVGWLSLGALVLASNSAQAYCRATTGQQPTFSCPDDCRELGTPFFWGTPVIEYAFNQNGFGVIGDGNARAVFAEAFGTWSSAECAGQQLGFRFEALAAPTPLTAGPIETEPNLNTISMLSAAQWEDLDYSPQAFAKTEVWFDRKTGEILGSDIVFNGAFSFALCPDTGCPPQTVDLQNVATHEIGHFLGLGHSQTPNAAMWCDAHLGDLQKRALKPDDIAGLCSIYDERNMFVDPGLDTSATRFEVQGGGGCSIDVRTPRGGGQTVALCWGLGLWVLFVRRSRLR